MAHATCKLMWIQNLMKKLNVETKKPIVMCCYNKSLHTLLVILCFMSTLNILRWMGTKLKDGKPSGWCGTSLIVGLLLKWVMEQGESFGRIGGMGRSLRCVLFLLVYSWFVQRCSSGRFMGWDSGGSLESMFLPCIRDGKDNTLPIRHFLEFIGVD